MRNSKLRIGFEVDGSVEPCRRSRLNLIGKVVVLACLVSASSVGAEEFDVAGFVIDIPARYEGPAYAEPDSHSKTYVFTVPAARLSPSAVLQISVYDAGVDLREPTDSELAEISRGYLLQMLAGVEHRRTEFRMSNLGSIRLAGFPGTTVAWIGKANGLETNGKMVCIVAATGIVFFHVMGGGSSPNPDMVTAIKAIDQLHRRDSATR